MADYFVRVVLDVPLFRCFDYRSVEPLPFGQRVAVKFRGRRECALVWDCFSDVARLEVDEARILPIEGVLNGMPTLPVAWRELVEFCADYYCFPLGAVAFAALPTAFRLPKDWKKSHQLIYTVLSEDSPAKSEQQQRLWATLLQHPPLAEARKVYAGAGAMLKKWLAAGMIAIVDRQAHRQVPADNFAKSKAPIANPNKPSLTLDQQEVLDHLSPLGQFAVDLLHGVTGSGKTEIYLRRIEAVLQRGEQCLILVPEISLTPQLEARFRKRFPQTLLVSLHSHLSDRDRADHWLAAAAGEASLVLGTRLSVFVPLPKLGAIIVDEEHDASFKQQDQLSYSARDLAIWRARQANVPILLGSATPSLESFWNAKNGRYRYLQLERRVGISQLPKMHLLDVRQEKMPAGISKLALAALQDRLDKGELSLVFINRRGYAPALFCDQCAWTMHCPHCSARLTLHQRERKMRCHHCGHTEAIAPYCPECGNVDIKPAGQGTQRIEEALREHFPAAKILRIDRDTVKNFADWEATYHAILRGEADILLGTQMLAKGHDFPALSLVVMLNVDGVVFSTDYRASEQAFATLLQVAGRAGRGALPGDVVIQTQFPEHAFFQFLQAHDFLGFCDYLLNERRDAGFPPFVFQAVLRADAKTLEEALAFLSSLDLDFAGVEAFDAVPARMQRLADRERAQRLFQAKRRADLRRALRALLAILPDHARQFSGLRWRLELDPLEI